MDCSRCGVGDKAEPPPIVAGNLCGTAGFRIADNDVGDFRTHAHLRQIQSVSIAERRLQSLLVLLGYVGGEPVADMRRTDDDLRAGGKRAGRAMS